MKGDLTYWQCPRCYGSGRHIIVDRAISCEACDGTGNALVDGRAAQHRRELAEIDERQARAAYQPVCELCGEPMPPGEEMFKYHGYSGPCPKPPKPKPAPISPAETPPPAPAEAQEAVEARLERIRVRWSQAGLTSFSQDHADVAWLLSLARRCYEAMTPAERQAMHEAQREGWVRSEMEMLRHEREMTRLARERAARAEGTKP